MIVVTIGFPLTRLTEHAPVTNQTAVIDRPTRKKKGRAVVIRYSGPYRRPEDADTETGRTESVECYTPVL
jgi:hypothetical protein